MLENPTFWVAVAFVVFFSFTAKKMFRFLGRSLDNHADRIRAELEEAKKLRAEAEALLAEYRVKQTEYLKEAEMILRKARADADILAEHAEKELKSAIDTRMKHAQEKIQAEETRAIQDVRSHIVDMTLAAARSVIVEQVSHMPQQEILALALADIERKIH